MSHTTRIVSLLVATALCAALTGSAFAQAIPIVNNSFEDNPNDGTWLNNGDGSSFPIPFITPTGWVGEGSVNVNEFTPNALTYPGGLPDGSYAAVCGPGSGDLYQVTSAVLTAGVTYTLSVYVGSRVDYDGTGTIAIDAWDGTNLTPLVSQYDAPVDGTFDDVTVQYTATNSDPLLGQQLAVWMGYDASTGENQASFDDVHFSQAVPEPGQVLPLTFGLAGLAWTRRRKTR